MLKQKGCCTMCNIPFYAIRISCSNTFYTRKDFIMKIFKQLLILFSVCLLSNYLVTLLPFPFPGSVLGMLLLLGLFLTNVIKPESLKEVAEFLLGNMAFFFLPAGVNILANYSVVQAYIFPIVIICVLSTILTFVATSVTVLLVMKFIKK